MIKNFTYYESWGMSELIAEILRLQEKKQIKIYLIEVYDDCNGMAWQWQAVRRAEGLSEDVARKEAFTEFIGGINSDEDKEKVDIEWQEFTKLTIFDL